MTDSEERRKQFVEALRELASFLETHPTVDAPSDTTINVFVRSKDDLVRHAKASSWEKVYNESYFWLRRTFGKGNIQYEVNAPRPLVCRKVTTGTHVVPAQPEREVEDYEWVCDEPSLLAEKETV